MNPRLPVHDSPDGALTDAIFFGHLQLFITVVGALADLSDLVLSQFRLHVGHAFVVGGAMLRAASLSNAVAHIVEVFAKEQMPRIAAWRVIAFVADKATFRDWSVDDFIDGAMGADATWSSRGWFGRVSVAVHVSAPSPRPALVWSMLLYAAPYALNERTLRHV